MRRLVRSGRWFGGLAGVAVWMLSGAPASGQGYAPYYGGYPYTGYGYGYVYGPPQYVAYPQPAYGYVPYQQQAQPAASPVQAVRLALPIHRKPPCLPPASPVPCPPPPAPCPPEEVKPAPVPEAKPAEPPLEPIAAEPAVSPETSAAVGGDSYVLSAPNMIGDQIQGGRGAVIFGGLIDGALQLPYLDGMRLNIAENNSPLPRDRVFFQYNYYHKATPTFVFGAGAALDVDAYTFGLEKAFFDNLASVEIIVPFFTQITSDPTAYNLLGGSSNIPFTDRDTEIGNVGLIGKLLLYQTDTFAFSTGMGINLPTADDVNVEMVNQGFFPNLPPVPLQIQARGIIRNETVNLVPFVAAVWAPNDRLFAQGFFQIDTPVNPSDAFFNGTIGLAGSPFQGELIGSSGKYEPPALSRLNVGGGYWLVRDAAAPVLTGLAPMLEVHYTAALNQPKLIEGALMPPVPRVPLVTTDVGNPNAFFNVVNLTVGSTFEFFNQMTLATAFVFPLTQGDDRWFDYEVNIQLGWRFGGPY